MLFFSRWNRISHLFICPNTVRQCSQYLNKLNNHEQITRLEKSSEDIASYVRFNREINRANFEDYNTFYSTSSNPDKSEHDLEAVRLRIAQICAEYEYFSYTSMRVPSSISLDDMRNLLKMSPEGRQVYFIKSYFRDTVKVRDNVKKIVKRNRKLECTANDAREFVQGCFSVNDDLQYGLWKNSLFSRIKSDGHRQRIQVSINAVLWGQILAFDWSFPVHLLDEDQKVASTLTEVNGTLVNPYINERSFRGLCLKIFKLCNHNNKNSFLGDTPFNIVHFNMNCNSTLYKYFEEAFHNSSVDKQFLKLTSHSYLQEFYNKKIIYINPHAEKTLDNEDMLCEKDIVFIFNPYTELIGLKPNVLKQIFLLKEQNEHVQNVHFRRLPIHKLTKNNGHIVLSHYILCLRDVLGGASWTEAAKKRIPRKYLLSDTSLA